MHSNFGYGIYLIEMTLMLTAGRTYFSNHLGKNDKKKIILLIAGQPGATKIMKNFIWHQNLYTFQLI